RRDRANAHRHTLHHTLLRARCPTILPRVILIIIDILREHDTSRDPLAERPALRRRGRLREDHRAATEHTNRRGEGLLLIGAATTELVATHVRRLEAPASHPEPQLALDDEPADPDPERDNSGDRRDPQAPPRAERV